MNFFRRWKKKEPTPDQKQSDDTRKKYYIAEFNSIGDATGSGTLNYVEFTRLMKLLGWEVTDARLRKIWKSEGKNPEGGQMTQDEYVKMMFKPKINQETNMWRKLFAEFDLDGSAWATKEEVMKGLGSLGAVSAKTKPMVNDMDTNHDKQISYGEFLKKQLHIS